MERFNLGITCLNLKPAELRQNSQWRAEWCLQPQLLRDGTKERYLGGKPQDFRKQVLKIIFHIYPSKLLPIQRVYSETKHGPEDGNSVTITEWWQNKRQSLKVTWNKEAFLEVKIIEPPFRIDIHCLQGLHSSHTDFLWLAPSLCCTLELYGEL